jgi:hypothetical protein
VVVEAVQEEPAVALQSRVTGVVEVASETGPTELFAVKVSAGAVYTGSGPQFLTLKSL